MLQMFQENNVNPPSTSYPCMCLIFCFFRLLVSPSFIPFPTANFHTPRQHPKLSILIFTLLSRSPILCINFHEKPATSHQPFPITYVTSVKFLLTYSTIGVQCYVQANSMVLVECLCGHIVGYNIFMYCLHLQRRQHFDHPIPAQYFPYYLLLVDVPNSIPSVGI